MLVKLTKMNKCCTSAVGQSVTKNTHHYFNFELCHLQFLCNYLRNLLVISEWKLFLHYLFICIFCISGNIKDFWFPSPEKSIKVISLVAIKAWKELFMHLCEGLMLLVVILLKCLHSEWIQRFGSACFRSSVPEKGFPEWHRWRVSMMTPEHSCSKVKLWDYKNKKWSYWQLAWCKVFPNLGFFPPNMFLLESVFLVISQLTGNIPRMLWQGYSMNTLPVKLIFCSQNISNCLTETFTVIVTTIFNECLENIFIIHAKLWKHSVYVFSNVYITKKGDDSRRWIRNRSFKKKK